MKTKNASKDEILAREEHQGIRPPASFANSANKILIWRMLVAGERISKHAVGAKVGMHLSSADRALNELHAEGKVHVVGWTRNGDRGPLTKVVAFGPGEDLPRPPKRPNALNCARWRNKNYEKALASDRACRTRRLLREGKMPRGNDPLLAAIMGVPAC